MKNENNIYKIIFNLIRNGRGGGGLLIIGAFALLSCVQPANNTGSITNIIVVKAKAAYKPDPTLPNLPQLAFLP
jgi:hypothetical protein